MKKTKDIKIIEEPGMGELEDDELDIVAGGRNSVIGYRCEQCEDKPIFYSNQERNQHVMATKHSKFAIVRSS